MAVRPQPPPPPPFPFHAPCPPCRRCVTWTRRAWRAPSQTGSKRWGPHHARVSYMCWCVCGGEGREGERGSGPGGEGAGAAPGYILGGGGAGGGVRAQASSICNTASWQMRCRLERALSRHPASNHYLMQCHSMAHGKRPLASPLLTHPLQPTPLLPLLRPDGAPQQGAAAARAARSGRGHARKAGSVQGLCARGHGAVQPR